MSCLYSCAFVAPVLGQASIEGEATAPSRHAGTIDHMGKPREGKAVPADDAPCHLLDQCSSGQPYWNFTSTGLRVTSMLISPW